MFGLFKRKKINSVVKYFKVVDLNTATSFDNKTFILDLLHFIDSLQIGSPTHYDLMGPYPKEGWTTKNGFLKALERKDFKNVVYLYISGDNFILRFTNWLPNFSAPPNKDTIDLCIEVDSEMLTLSNLIVSTKQLTDKIEFDYGYGFISNKSLGLSESNAKERWYGITSKSDPNETKWAHESVRIDEGKIKSLFSLNFLSKKYHTKILKTITQLNPDSIKSFDSNLDIWAIEAKDLEKYRNDFSDYIILNNTQLTAGT